MRSVRLRRLAVSCPGAFGLALFAAMPARAEFPPEGAVADPTNPSTATGNLPDSKHAGTLLPYVFYFDCGKRQWIGVAVAGPKDKQSTAPSAVGTARQFPPGPPPGAKLDAHDPTRAANHTSGQSFTLRDGNWVDVKTGADVKSPKLCANDMPPVKTKPAGSADPATPDQQAPAGPQPISPQNKPDHLPPPPDFIKH